MIAEDAAAPRLRPAAEPPARRDAVRLLVVGPAPTIRPVTALPALLRPGDLLVVNDAATWPAALAVRTPDGVPLELRLTTGAFGPGDRVPAVVLGPGDWRTPTEHRPPPPPLVPGTRLLLAPGEWNSALRDRDTRASAAPGEWNAAPGEWNGAVEVAGVRPGTARVIEVAIPRDDEGFRALLAAGRPVQYAYAGRTLAPWDVATAFGGRPWAAEMPSAGRPLSWALLGRLRARGVAIARVTHAAGLSSTGDPALDATLPWPERFEVPATTAAAVRAARAGGGRVIAAGTTVVRALETAARDGAVRAAAGTTDLVIDARHRRRAVDGILSGLHGPADSHFRVLEAFAPRAWLLAAHDHAAAAGLLGHELGDCQLVLDLAIPSVTTVT